jgi:hypothetical protein
MTRFPLHYLFLSANVKAMKVPFLLVWLNHASFLPLDVNWLAQLKGQTKRRLILGVRPRINRQ